MGLSVVAFGSFVFGSSNQRKVKPLLFEMMVASVCTALSVMAGAGLLTSMQFGVGLLACVAGGVVIANCFEKSPIKEVLSPFELPSLPLRIVDTVVGLGRDVTVGAKAVLTYVTHRKNYSSTILDSQDADALCVMLTGLMAPPSVFDDYHDQFAGLDDRKITLFQPHIPKLGNCSLEDAASAIYGEVAAWAVKNPKKPIVLIGVSNGTRIAGYISSKLKSEQKGQNPINVSCIAGLFNGTKFVNRPDWPCFFRSLWGKIFKIFFSDKLFEEFSWESDRVKQLSSEIEEASKKGVHYDFYSSSSDTQILPFTSGFPEVKDANYFLTFAEGHASISRAVKDQIIERSLEAISQNREESYPF